MVGLSARCSACLVVAQMRHVRGPIWFLLAFVLAIAFGSRSVHAETIAATATVAPAKVYMFNWTSGSNSYMYSNGQDACSTWTAANYPGWVFTVSYTGSGDSQSAVCVFSSGAGLPYAGYSQNIGKAQTCPVADGAQRSNPATCPTTYSCPAGQNWTLSGTSCTRPDCTSAQSRNPSTGICEITCPAAGSNAMIGGAQAWGISGSSATCTAGISYGGCKITCTAGVSASGKASCTGCTFTGGQSSVSDAAADPTTGEEIKAPTKPEECLAKGMGYVTSSSGTTCVAQDQAVEPISTKTTETTTTKNGSGVTTGTEETTVECIGDKCTTTTTNKDGAGVTTGTTTSTGTGDKSGTDPTKDEQSECEKHPETIGCSQYGTPVEDGPLTSNSVGTSSLSPALSSAGSCPADINLPRGMKFSWEYPCMYASGIRPVVIALAWLSAGFLLFGMRLD